MLLHVFFRFLQIKTGFWLGILGFGVATSIFNTDKIEDRKFPQNQRKINFIALFTNFTKGCTKSILAKPLQKYTNSRLLRYLTPVNYFKF